MCKFIILFLVSVMAVGYGHADTFSLSETENQLITNEADDWIDDMPDGLQDRMADAINHSLHGFLSELQYFRNLADTAGIHQYKVETKIINGGKAGDIPMKFYTSSLPSSQAKPLLIFFHGGGWALGSLNVTEKFCRALSSQGNVNIISVDYPLSPENPWPAAIHKGIDAVEFIRGNCEKFGSESSLISLGGDGAGGNIALETYIGLSDKAEIRSIVLYYPLLNRSDSIDREMKRKYGRGYGLDSRLLEAFNEAYKKETSDNISSAENSFPPILIIASGRDMIINEEKEFAVGNKDVTLIEFEGAIHGFITDGHQNTAFKKAVEFTDIFLSK